ncbi:MAG: hypothetical protein ACI4OR_02555 [Alphaproteobacteria bacterium]
MAEESKSVSGNILFKLFWWIALHLNPQWANRLMYFGLRDGSFGKSVMRDSALKIQVWGHTFNTPIGIAGGVDKRGNVIDRLMQIGYGFGTFGPYTLEKEMPMKQTHYLKKEKSILAQSLGFRNPGLLKMLPWFVKRRYLPHFVGVDLAIPAESEDQNIKQGRHFTYQEEFVLMSQKIAPYCDFVTLDLSHPNSELSMLVVDSSTMVPMIKAVKEAVRVAAPIQTPPILVKIPLDLNTKEVPLVARNLMDSGVDGVIVAGPLSMSKNNLLQLPGLKDEHVGMLTGALVKEQTVNLIRQIYEKTKGQLVIVGCGGVFTAEDALAQIQAGASLIQLDMASLTFAGPACVSEIHTDLLRLLKEKNFASVSNAVGFAAKAEMAAQAAEAAPETVVNAPEAMSQAQNVVPPSQPALQPQQPVAQTIQPEVQPSAPAMPALQPEVQAQTPAPEVQTQIPAPVPPVAPTSTPTPVPPVAPPMSQPVTAPVVPSSAPAAQTQGEPHV